eukprot:2463469-Prymnesium_polylepis.1
MSGHCAPVGYYSATHTLLATADQGECPLTRHRPQVRRVTHTQLHVYGTMAYGLWPMVRRKAVSERYAAL